jgi:hypothetical protein
MYVKKQQTLKIYRIKMTEVKREIDESTIMAGASTLPFQQSIELVERKSAKHSLAVSV